MPTPGDRLSALHRSWRRAVLRRRRPLAALLAGVAVLAAISAVRAPAAPTVAVTVAAHDVASGRTLTASDLTIASWARGTAPAGVATDAVGRVLAAPLRRGEPVTDVRLVGPALTAQDSGLVAVPVRLPDAGSVDLLTVGDHIDLVAADPQGGAASEVATDVPVLAIPAAPAEAATTGLPGRLVVLGVAPEDVTAVARAAVSALVTYTWSSH